MCWNRCDFDRIIIMNSSIQFWCYSHSNPIKTRRLISTCIKRGLYQLPGFLGIIHNLFPYQLPLWIVLPGNTISIKANMYRDVPRFWNLSFIFSSFLHFSLLSLSHSLLFFFLEFLMLLFSCFSLSLFFYISLLPGFVITPHIVLYQTLCILSLAS